MSTSKPNIVFIMTDQERLPRHMRGVNLDAILPWRAHLYRKGVSYDNFYINAAPCTPNRSVIFTGLYTQQTWMVGNAEMKQPDLKPEFPTFGTALRDQDYATHYFGKWHLSTHPEGVDALSIYGFDDFALAEEYHGDPNQGGRKDPQIGDSAAAFLAQAHDKPFLAVISFINPHDIMYYPDKMIPRKPPAEYKGMLPPANFETIEQLRRNKPLCHAQYKQLYEYVMGDMPADINTPEGKQAYIDYMNYYLWLQSNVDQEIGKVIRALENSPNRGNTIVIFTADHGDQIGSHGLSGKQCCVYEESLNVPFCVVDYTQATIPAGQAGTKRTRFGSSIDIFPTILNLAVGKDAPLPEKYAYLSGVSLLSNIIDDNQPTKDEVLFTYDFNLPGVVSAPDHIRCCINSEWKGAVYEHWGMDNATQDQPSVEEGAVDPRPGLVQYELYPRTHGDRLELDNLANEPKYQEQMAQIKQHLDDVLQTELRAELPSPMKDASEAAKAGYVALQQYSPVTPADVSRDSKDYLG